MLHMLMNRTQKLLFVHHKGRKVNLNSSSDYSDDKNVWQFQKNKYKKANIEQLLLDYQLKSTLDHRLIQGVLPNISAKKESTEYI